MAAGRSPATATRPMIEILPDFVQAWCMLQDSGLDVHDRNMIQTAVGKDFALRASNAVAGPRAEAQGPDRYWGEAQEQSGDEEDGEAYDRSWMEHGMSEESLAAMDAAEDIQEAMAAMQTARRTLKEARAKQKFVKLSRKYYQNSGASRGQRGPAPDDSKMTDDLPQVRPHRASRGTLSRQEGHDRAAACSLCVLS